MLLSSRSLEDHCRSWEAQETGAWWGKRPVLDRRRWASGTWVLGEEQGLQGKPSQGIWGEQLGEGWARGQPYSEATS